MIVAEGNRSVGDDRMKGTPNRGRPRTTTDQRGCAHTVSALQTLLVQNTRFAIGVHILTVLAIEDGEPVSSEKIAASVNTNPSFIRQVMGQLREAKLVTSRLGAGGGAVLSKSAASIRLDQVYRATESKPPVGLHHSEPSKHCVVGRNIRPVLASVLDRAERAVLDELKRKTVADVAGEVERLG